MSSGGVSICAHDIRQNEDVDLALVRRPPFVPFSNLLVSIMIYRSAILLISILASGSAAYADLLTLDVTLNSSLQTNGSFSAANVSTTLVPQAAGADTTLFSGTIDIEVDSLANPTSIQILGASLTAANSGSWSPLADGSAGTALANYGLRNSGSAIGASTYAVRSLNLNLTSGILTVDGSGHFSTSGLNIFVTGGSLAYNPTGASPVGESQSFSLAPQSNLSSFVSSYSFNGTTATLNLPLAAIYTFNLTAPGAPGTASINLFGTITGTTLVPEPSSIALVTVGVMALTGTYLRRRKS
jgi:hypothetical protein